MFKRLPYIITSLALVTFGALGTVKQIGSSAIAAEILHYNVEVDTTVGTHGKEHDYSISRPILDEGVISDTLNDVTEKLRGSWDFATLYAAMLDVDGLGGLSISKITAKSKEIAKKKDDAFRYRVADAWLAVVATGRIKLFTANGGSFYSQYYYKGAIKGANRSTVKDDHYLLQAENEIGQYQL